MFLIISCAFKTKSEKEYFNGFFLASLRNMGSLMHFIIDPTGKGYIKVFLVYVQISIYTDILFKGSNTHSKILKSNYKFIVRRVPSPENSG